MSNNRKREEMEHSLDLHDIQGNLVKSYGRFQYPKARYIFYRVHGEVKGRAFVSGLWEYITTGERWNPQNPQEKPLVTTNIAFTYSGLKHLGLPRKSLQTFPEEFAMGMKARRDILGDDSKSAPQHWDPIWQQNEPVDIWVSINGQTLDAVEERYKEICAVLASCGGADGVEQVTGHRGPNSDYQDASVLYENGQPSGKEHFGYRDGISDPYFKGSGRNKRAVVGDGKPTRQKPDTAAGWEPLETGEFILGYRDESQEYPVAPMPRLLSFNGTFMVYRKLHQNVGSFNLYVEEVGQHFPGGKEALMAKFAGRWPNGAPLALFPIKEDADRFIAKLTEAEQKRRMATGVEKTYWDEQYYELRSQMAAFKYNDDLSGARCPIGSHIRRTNPRGALEFWQGERGEKTPFATPGALTNRRRLLRRGAPYGEVKDPNRDDGDHGIVFMVIGASIKRQFEFVQQQWINYSNDFKLGNEKDPLLGNHGEVEGRGTGRMVIEADPKGDNPPFFCANLPRFVETRGGDYFFLPSLTALRMIADGIVDPT